MSRLKDYLRLLRVEQWYKNLVLLLPLLFVTQVREPLELLLALLGFCFISSVTYIINDWWDRAEDRLHPTKKERPIASGRITGRQAEVAAFILLLLVGGIGYFLGDFYLLAVGVYFVATSLYCVGLKQVPILDVSMIAGNFILRMLGGMEHWPQPKEWPIFLFVFSAMILFLTHKRRSDIKILGIEKAVAHKPVLKYYSRPLAYAMRSLAYLGAAYALLHLPFSWVDRAGPLLIMMVTSAVFVQKPFCVLKPQLLLKEPGWLFVTLLSVALMLAF